MTDTSDPSSRESPGSSTEGPRILITGGAGFLGQALVRELLHPRGERHVSPREIRIFDRRAPATAEPGVVAIEGDLRDPTALAEVCRDIDVVIHTASLVDYGHAAKDVLYDINVRATERLLRICSEAGVRAFVHTSSMDVIYARKPVRDGDETIPYPEKFADEYARTKALGEQAALAANAARRSGESGELLSSGKLRVSVIRPCGMYGEADPYHVSSVLRMAEAGTLTARMGSGNAVFQHVYVGNVAHAHVMVLANLLSDDPVAAGEIYLVTDFPAENFFDFMEILVTRLGFDFPSRSRSIPYGVAYALGSVVELAARLMSPWRNFQPALTRSSVRIVCQDFSFSGEKIARELGYAPVYDNPECFERTVEWFRKHGPLPAPEIPKTFDGASAPPPAMLESSSAPLRGR